MPRFFGLLSKFIRRSPSNSDFGSYSKPSTPRRRFFILRVGFRIHRWVAGHSRAASGGSSARLSSVQTSLTRSREAPIKRRPFYSESLESRQFLSAAISFAQSTVYPTHAGYVATADFNHDGLPDLVTASAADNIVSVRLNQGNGAFGTARNYYVFDPHGIAVGDFNGDGNLDFAVLSSNASNTSSVSIFYGTGDGMFVHPPKIINLNATVTAIAAGDINGDGHPDLIITTLERVLVLLNNGDGTFAKPVSYGAGPGNSGQVVVGDFNHDGLDDVAILRRGDNDNYVAILLARKTNSGLPTGTLGRPVLYRVGNSPKQLTTGDFNGDGSLDLAVVDELYHQPAVQILLGNGDGTFASKESYSGGNFVDGIATGDFNGDGKTDIATVSFTSGLRVYAGNGDGTFAPFTYFPGARYGENVVAADFNGDGKQDIAIATGGSIKVLLANGSTTPAPPASSLTVTLGDGAPHAAIYHDVGGALGTVSLAGPGSATVVFSGANLSIDAAGNVIGGTAAISSVSTTGTTAASTLIINAIGKNGRINVAGVSVDSAIKAIFAPRANLSGTLNVAGPIRSIDLNSVSGGTINLLGTGPAVNLSLGNVNEGTLATTQPIGTLSLGQWFAVAGTASGITAPVIGQIDSANSLDANLSIAGGLGAVSARQISAGNWRIGGAVGAIRVLHGAAFSLLSDSLNRLSAGGALAGTTIQTVGSIGAISAGALINSTIVAGAGANPLPPGQRPFSGQFVNPLAKIGSVTLARVAQQGSFINGSIAAATLGNLNLGLIAFSNGGVPQGLASSSVTRLSGSDLVTGKSFSLFRPFSLSTLSSRGINPADFRLEFLVHASVAYRQAIVAL